MGQALWQMDPVGADTPRQARIPADQQFQAPVPGDNPQTPGHNLCLWCAERSVDDGGSPGQPPGDGFRIGGADRVGEEQQRGRRVSQTPAAR